VSRRELARPKPRAGWTPQGSREDTVVVAVRRSQAEAVVVGRLPAGGRPASAWRASTGPDAGRARTRSSCTQGRGWRCEGTVEAIEEPGRVAAAGRVELPRCCPSPGSGQETARLKPRAGWMPIGGDPRTWS
jgi:hypothetical protein